MRKITLTYLFCFAYAVFTAQINLVPNHSFEVQDTCPTNIYTDSPSGFAKYWFDIRNTPDYFTNCFSVNSNYQTPNNSFGYQCPANGNSYLGLYTMAGFTNPGAQEAAAVKLIDSLIINTKYFVSFKLVHSGGNGVYYATSKMGLKFFTKQPDCLNPVFGPTDKYVNNFSHVYTNQIVTDTTNWTTVKGSFIADSNYKYLAIGCFFSYQNADTTKIYSASGFKLSYYFIDDICVSSDSIICNIPTQTQNPCSLSTNFKTNNLSRSLILAPNPARDVIQIENITADNLKNYFILNSMGAVIMEGNNSKIDISNLPNGIYIIKIQTDFGLKQTKIIINH